MKRVETPHIIVYLPDEVTDWPAHFREVNLKINALEELIQSIIKGIPERQQITDIRTSYRK